MTANCSVPVEEHTASGNWARVDAGIAHSCAISIERRLFCWGAAFDGGLGNNNVADRRVPVQEATLAMNWATVASGGEHSCAIKSDGRLFCWGNGFGRLGILGGGDSRVPVQESTGSNDWVGVTAGGDHSCAVKLDGRLLCWGENDFGQLGDNSSMSRDAPTPEALNASNWVSTSAGDDHTCAVNTDGRIFCWGRGEQGQLGNNATLNTPAPVVEATNAEDWAQVSAGGRHSCAVKTDGRLFCWGAGGQLGNNGTGNSSIPVQEALSANDWVTVSAGSAHSCAVKTDGRLFCWGNGAGGKLGNGATTNSLVPVQEGTVATDWADVTAGEAHTCATKADGRVLCWGSGISGQIGNGEAMFVNLLPVQEATGAANWRLVAAGRAHNCAIKALQGRLFCWGASAQGQLGIDNIVSVWPAD